MKIKKLACLVFAIVLAVSCISASVFADNTEYTQDFSKINVGKYGNGTVSDDNGNHVFSLVPNSTTAYPAYAINSDEFGTSFGGSYKIEYRWKDNYVKEPKDTHNIFILSLGFSNGTSKFSVKPCWLWASGSLRTPADVDNVFITTTTPGEWYTTVIDVDSASGIYNMKITDSEGKELSIYTGGKDRALKSGTDTSAYYLNNINFMGCYNSTQSEFVLDYVKIYKQANAPVAANAEIIGNAKVGEILTAYADISDPDGDELGLPLYQWKSSADGETWENIEDANSNVYTPVEADVGKYIAVDITPVSTVEPKHGVTVTAQTENKISAAAASNPSISSVAPNVGNYEAADGKTYKSAVMYFKIAANGWAVDSCGVILKDADGNPLTLNSSYAGDAFAIRVYGNAITEGSAYTFAGFANVSNDGKTEKLVDTEGNFTIK